MKRIKAVLRDQTGAGSISLKTVFFIVFLFFIFVVFLNFTIVFAQMQRIESNAYRALDSIVSNQSIGIYNSLKSGKNVHEVLPDELIRTTLRDELGLTEESDELVAYSASGTEQYRIRNLQLDYTIENTLTLRLRYTVGIYLNFIEVGNHLNLNQMVESDYAVKF